MQVFSLAELAAWLTRAAFWSIFLSSIAIKALVTPLGEGIIQDNFLRNIYFILSALFLNLISGRPKFFLAKNEQNLQEKKEYYLSSGVFSTLFFLMQGLKVKEVERNLVVLSGLKKVLLFYPYGSRMRIENKEPIKMIDYIITIIIILIALAVLILAPTVFIALNNCISHILSAKGFPSDFSEILIFLFGIVVLVFYFSPYIANNRQYQPSVITTFKHKIENIYSNFPVYVSPMMLFLEKHYPLGHAHKKEIYINPLIAENDVILQYIIAHEEGHIRDPYTKLFCLLLSLLFPWGVFIVVSRIAYLYSIDKLNYSLWKIILISISIIILIFIISFKIKQMLEERAVNFAIKKIGIEKVVMACREIAYGDNALPEYYRNKYRYLLEKHIERVKERCY